jgi:hypothetical protein
MALLIKKTLLLIKKTILLIILQIAIKKTSGHSMGQYWTLDLKYWTWTGIN